MAKINIKALKAKSAARTNEIAVGQKYFLSIFHDKEGVWVEVLDKSAKINRAGFPSTVTYKILEQVGVERHNAPSYEIGKIGNCNATNLYERQELASPAAKYGF